MAVTNVWDRSGIDRVSTANPFGSLRHNDSSDIQRHREELYSGYAQNHMGDFTANAFGTQRGAPRTDESIVHTRRQEEERNTQSVIASRDVARLFDRVNSRLHHVEEELERLHRNPVIILLESEILALRKRIDKLEEEKRAKRDKQIKQKNTRNNLNKTKNNTKEDILKRPYGY